MFIENLFFKLGFKPIILINFSFHWPETREPHMRNLLNSQIIISHCYSMKFTNSTIWLAAVTSILKAYGFKERAAEPEVNLVTLNWNFVGEFY